MQRPTLLPQLDEFPLLLRQHVDLEILEEGTFLRVQTVLRPLKAVQRKLRVRHTVDRTRHIADPLIWLCAPPNYLLDEVRADVVPRNVLLLQLLSGADSVM